MTLEIIPISVKHEVDSETNIADLILKSKTSLEDNDIIVISQKIVSKQEGRIVDLALVFPTLLSQGIASEYDKDPKLVEAILSESKRIVRMENGILIVETNHGFICANAGIDESNVPAGKATLLPKNPDESAQKIKDTLQEKSKKQIAVLISDTFGRPFRMGQSDCAIGVSGLNPILDYAGKKDTFDKELRVTAIAVADELCSAAELVMGKTNHCPIAIIRNYEFERSEDSINSILRSESQDLFR